MPLLQATAVSKQYCDPTTLAANTLLHPFLLPSKPVSAWSKNQHVHLLLKIKQTVRQIGQRLVQKSTPPIITILKIKQTVRQTCQLLKRTVGLIALALPECWQCLPWHNRTAELQQWLILMSTPLQWPPMWRLLLLPVAIAAYVLHCITSKTN